jgi:alpha,alpha-trehalose-phosphate synthase [UDP-forming]
VPTKAHATAKKKGGYDFLIVANRLPVDRVEQPDGSVDWQPSPGGLVTAMEPVMRSTGGAWIGWAGSPGDAPEPFDAGGIRLLPVSLSAKEVVDYYEGFSNATLWPLYHDVIAPPQFHRRWWDAYVRINQRFASLAVANAARGATVWVHDYQLQLVPAMIRQERADVRIGFFNHIPFPGYEIFAQLPWRRQVVEGLLGADLIGFQRPADATNFLRACRRAAGLQTKGPVVTVPVGVDTGKVVSVRDVRAATFPISIDFAAFSEMARRDDVQARAKQIRADLGEPEVVLLGVDRLDYTKGILHRLKAYEELLGHGLEVPAAALVQVASPSRERVEQYQVLRDEVEATVGRINGSHATLGHPAVHYLHHSYERSEMVALYLASDVMLVTSLRDGMNLVAKEYIACRNDESGALVLSEFTGAADELGSAFLVNPHDIDGMKDKILRAVNVDPVEARRRMRSMRKRGRNYDVERWATSFLRALDAAPGAPTQG